MNQYEMPADTSEKEKAIGGILTFTQGGIIGGFAILGFALLLLIGKVFESILFGVIFLIPCLIAGAYIAFKKKMDMPIYKYWQLKRKFDAKTKKLVHINERKPIQEGL